IDKGVGGSAYKALATINGDKAASVALLKAGIDGVKYPAESLARGTTSDNARGFNYVVFDENAVTIKQRTQFQQKGGEIYGAVKDGEVILNAEKMNFNSPLHEVAGHIFLNWAKDNN